MVKGGISRWQNKSSKGMSRKVREAIYLSRLNACSMRSAYRANIGKNLKKKEKEVIKAVIAAALPRTQRSPAALPRAQRSRKPPQWYSPSNSPRSRPKDDFPDEDDEENDYDRDYRLSLSNLKNLRGMVRHKGRATTAQRLLFPGGWTGTGFVAHNVYPLSVPNYLRSLCDGDDEKMTRYVLSNLYQKQ